jgi:superfamily II DNA or RNA helicase
MRLSHSRLDVFNNCKRWFWNNYIAKIPAPPSDTRHLRRGSAFHEVAEYIIKENPQIVQEVHETFLAAWDKYKLEDFGEQKDATYLMLLTFFKERPTLTSTEYKIFVNDPEFLGYIDGLNTNTDTIIDYKTSVYYEPDAYKNQLGRYSLFYWKQFGRIPKCEVWYVKYAPFRKTTYVFTVEEMLAYEKEIREVNDYIEKNINVKEKFPCAETCHVFCPYKTVCEKFNEGLALKLTIENSYVTIFGEISPMLNKGLKKKFSYELKDAFWIKKNNPMANTWVRLWDEHKHRLPIGFLAGLLKTLKDYAEHERIKLTIAFDDKRILNTTEVLMPDKFVSNVVLRDYQKETVDKLLLEHDIGMMQLPTGSGKTIVFTEVIRRKKVKTLVVVDKIELLIQTRNVIEANLGIKVGTIGQGVSDIKDVTVATIQSLNAKLKEYSEYLSTVRMVIFDECHKISASSFVKVGRKLVNASNIYGCSGTIYRDDGNDMLIHSIAGDIVHRIEIDKLISEGYLIKPTIQFYEVESSNFPADEYAEIYKNEIQNNVKRTTKICNLVNDLRSKNKKVLILTKLIEHGDILRCLIPESEHLHGTTDKNERARIMDNFRGGKTNVLVSTVSIFSEGIDIPSLDVVINVSANKGSVKTVQILGRVLRTLSGKKEALYIDFIDSYKMMKSASKARIRILEKEGHDVVVVR